MDAIPGLCRGQNSEILLPGLRPIHPTVSRPLQRLPQDTSRFPGLTNNNLRINKIDRGLGRASGWDVRRKNNLSGGEEHEGRDEAREGGGGTSSKPDRLVPGNRSTFLVGAASGKRPKLGCRHTR